MTPASPKTVEAPVIRPAKGVVCLALSCLLAGPGMPFAQDATTLDTGSLQTTNAANSSLTPTDADTGAGADAAISTSSTSSGPLDATALAGSASLQDETGAISDDFGRMNLREGTVEGMGRPTANDGGAPGIRLGTFLLKPSITENVVHETVRSGSSRESRSYLETGLKGVLSSDWSRHALTITADGTWQKNFAGSGEAEPYASIKGDLRLDLTGETTADIDFGYNFQREESTDPNAVEGATVQSGIHTFSGGARVKRDFGLLRGSTGVSLSRTVYGAATLSDDTELSMRDRDVTSGTLTGRIGYELSPALIPYIEASIARSRYDLRTDTLGYERSYNTYGGRGGVEVDISEKLSGEIALGYMKASFDDERLNALDAVTLDGSLAWSPQRGTNVDFRFGTGVEASTTANESGSVNYTAGANLSHELRSNLVARLTNSVIWRNYPSGSVNADQTEFDTGVGLTWDFTRYLALNGDVSYERVISSGGSATTTTRFGVGLTLRR